MSKKKNYKTKTKEPKANEPVAAYGAKRIHFFKSFEEQEEYELIQMAALSPKELLNKLEMMRRFFLRTYLTADGNWPPLKRIITITKPKSNGLC